MINKPNYLQYAKDVTNITYNRNYGVASIHLKVNSLLTNIVQRSKDARIGPLYFQSSVKIDINMLTSSNHTPLFPVEIKGDSALQLNY